MAASTGIPVNFDEEFMEKLNASILETAEKFKYVPFDPITFASALEKASAGDQDFKNHVAKMILYYLKWGNISTAKKKSSEKEKQTVAMLQKKYDIKDRGGQGYSTTIVTLSRVSAAFPIVTCQILQDGLIETPVTSRHLDALKLTIPLCMRTTSFFSLIPCTESEKIFRLKLVKVCLVYQYLEATAKNPAKRRKHPAEIVHEMLKRLSETYKSKCLNASQRLDYIKLWNINEADTASGVSYYEEYLGTSVLESLLTSYFGSF